MITALEEFDALGVGFVSYSENIDTTTPMGRAMFTILGALSELEKSIIIERSVEGQRRARERGVHVGRPRVEVDEDQVRHLRAQGLSLRAVAKLVGVGKNVVLRVLKETPAK